MTLQYWLSSDDQVKQLFGYLSDSDVKEVKHLANSKVCDVYFSKDDCILLLVQILSRQRDECTKRNESLVNSLEVINNMTAKCIKEKK